MERVEGIGGLFFRARDVPALTEWYVRHLGVANPSQNVWWQRQGPTVWAPFPADTEYFAHPGQAWMVNFRVRDLDAMLAQLRAAGVNVEDRVEVEEGVGRFGWVRDPEDNRIELWEPAPEVLAEGPAEPAGPGAPPEPE